MRRKVFSVLPAMLLAFAVYAQPPANAQTPDQLVRQVSERIIELIKANRETYTRDHGKLYEMVEREVLPYFDFNVMARSVLGRYWRDATPEQRERFAKEFKDLLVRTYATALLKYTDEQIRVLPLTAKPDDKRVLVRTQVVRGGGGPPIEMNYSFYRSDTGWKVYDVSIEGVSLVTNYRTAYAEKIRSQGLDALINSLAEANRRGQVDPAVIAPKGTPGR